MPCPQSEINTRREIINTRKYGSHVLEVDKTNNGISVCFLAGINDVVCFSFVTMRQFQAEFIAKAIPHSGFCNMILFAGRFEEGRKQKIIIK